MPDTRLFPEFFGARSVTFRAGLELAGDSRAVHAYEPHEYAEEVEVVGAGMAAATEWLNALAAGSTVVDVTKRLLRDVGLLVDLGSPWRLPVPIFLSHGTLSVMFEVAWCVALYSTVLAIEFLPPFFEWLGWSKMRARVLSLALPATIAGRQRRM